jgi:hypothetical protein
MIFIIKVKRILTISFMDMDLWSILMAVQYDSEKVYLIPYVHHVGK